MLLECPQGLESICNVRHQICMNMLFFFFFFSIYTLKISGGGKTYSRPQNVFPPTNLLQPKMYMWHSCYLIDL